MEVPDWVAETTRRAGLAGLPTAAVGVAGLVVAVALLFAAVRLWGGGSDVVLDRGEPPPTTSAADAGPASTSMPATAPAAAAAGKVYVHVVGAVRSPGVYAVPADARVADAVAAASGLKPDAAPQGVNLARRVQDGEQIVVPTVDELSSGTAPVGPAATTPSGSGPGAPPTGAAPGRVNLNTADAAQLDTLPGVGPATAQKIVEDRTANGPFASVEDLGRVSGIGPKKIETLSELVCVQ